MRRHVGRALALVGAVSVLTALSGGPTDRFVFGALGLLVGAGLAWAEPP